MCVCLFVYVYVHSQAIKNHSCKMTNQTNPQFLCMTLGVDIIDGHGLSNEVYHEFQPKKSKVMPYLPCITVTW